MNIIRLIALATGILALAPSGPAQTPYQSHEAAVKIYATGDLAFGIQEKVAIALECRASTGRELHGSLDFGFELRDEFTVVSGDGVSWKAPVQTSFGTLPQWLDGQYTATLGSASVGVLAESGNIHFAEASPLLDAIRLHPNTLTISISERESGRRVAAESFNTSGVDICRFAYACGDQHHILAACGSSVSPPSPQVQMLKRDIEAVLSGYPTDP